MRFSDTLPKPSLEALAHSAKLSAKITQTIQVAGGQIPFYTFMQMALYEPGLGYYVAGLQKLGVGGDFVTAPEISPLFAQCLAEQCAQVLNGLKDGLEDGVILELGAGSGRMAVDILKTLQASHNLPAQYWILELSPDLRQRQQALLQTELGDYYANIQWLDNLPQTPFRGVIVGNEVLDAMPVELFSLVADERVSRAVRYQPRSDTELFALDELTSACTRDYTSEYNPALPAWLQGLSTILDAGLVLLIDYGYEAAEYYHPERRQGTLVCHYQHHVHDNPFVYVGLQDISASVDFSAVATASTAAGFEVAGYCSQAAFLTSAGLEHYFAQALEQAPEQQYALAQQVKRLCLPSEMGERFRVMALTKAFTLPLCGFKLAGRQHRL